MTRISKVTLKEPKTVLIFRQMVCENGKWIHAVFKGYDKIWHRFR